MSWYLAKMIFRICTPEKASQGQFEEQLHLIRGETEVEALQKASGLGEKGDSEFINASGQTIRWEFIAVSELHFIPELEDGVELTSRIEEMEDVDSYIALQRDKHIRLFLKGGSSANERDKKAG